ncbi:hypothetical protein ACIF8T_33475 [Streptomyces sp. NPDC085946]|uniref:hypothetical protein n=1 Tax=Streptomyces sp. NPDC085946 TaxID=3365744 RepID=UPI0037D862E0
MITAEHIRDLLESDADDPRLVVVSGAAAVVPAAELETDRYRGAMEVVSRRDLLARLGTGEASRPDPAEIAARLDATVTRLGA